MRTSRTTSTGAIALALLLSITTVVLAQDQQPSEPTEEPQELPTSVEASAE